MALTNIVNIYTPPNYIAPERITTFELGAKLDFFRGLLRVNGALFDNRLKDLQSGFVSLLSGGAVQFVTVPRARSRGARIRCDPGAAGRPRLWASR